MGPTVLILVPTLEVAAQIQAKARESNKTCRVICVCDGAQMGVQIIDLHYGADIVVATPGRLSDILRTKRNYLGQVSLLVLDEVDRTVGMGWEPHIREVVNKILPGRQTLMYVATWPEEVKKIADDLLNNPVQVNIKSVEEPPKHISQCVEVVPDLEKQRRVDQILRNWEVGGEKVIIFCTTKRTCDELACHIRRNYSLCAVIHGDQNKGESVFCGAAPPILIATGVAAREIDVTDIRVVINYDFPAVVEDYVHQIRCTRRFHEGTAYTFFSNQDWNHARDLVKALEEAKLDVPSEVRDKALRVGPQL